MEHHTLTHSEINALFASSTPSNRIHIDKPFCSVKMQAESIDDRLFYTECNINAFKPTRIKCEHCEDIADLALVFVLNGCTCHYSNGMKKAQEVHQGEFVFQYSPTQSGYSDFIEKNPVFCSSLRLDSSILLEFLQQEPRLEVKQLFNSIFDNPNKFFNLKANLTGEIEELIIKLRQQHKIGLVNSFERRATAYQLLQKAFDQLIATHTPKNTISLTTDDVIKLEKAKSIIEQNIQTPPTLIELSRMVGINEFKLKRGFKQTYHKTVFAHLNQTRMQQAAKLLTDSTKAIVEVAQLVGYNNHGHFSSAFKDYFGQTPSAYRKHITTKKPKTA